jgi:hypothetical protein
MPPTKLLNRLQNKNKHTDCYFQGALNKCQTALACRGPSVSFYSYKTYFSLNSLCKCLVCMVNDILGVTA